MQSICNEILSHETPQEGMIRAHQVQSVDWRKRQAADEAISSIASLVEKWKKPSCRKREYLSMEAKSILHDFDSLVLTDGVLYQKQQKGDQEVYELELSKELS